VAAGERRRGGGKPQGGRRAQGGGRGGAADGSVHAAPPARGTQPRPLPYRVARWGKFWSLEPLFADARAYFFPVR
jgi:hypothetical protein